MDRRYWIAGALALTACSSDAFTGEPGTDADAAADAAEASPDVEAPPSVRGFGEVEGECATCLTGVVADGECAADYEACLADPTCGKMLDCVQRCAVDEPHDSGEAYMDCVLDLCYAGSTDAQKIMVQDLYACVCCSVATCRTECTDRCEAFDSPAGPIMCMF